MGEVIGGLSGPVQTLREASPQALHHFTQADQVNQLVSASSMSYELQRCRLPLDRDYERPLQCRINSIG